MLVSTSFTRLPGACAHHQEAVWTPGVSGGDHAPAWPPEVEALLRKRLSSKPPASYSFAASEVLRLCHYKLDRAQVRRWAMENNLAHPKPNHRPTAPVKRWQRSRIGELWQLDATPHRGSPTAPSSFPMLNMLDDCSRVFTGSKIYEREILLAYFDFLPAAFLAYGLPLEIYVDYHSFFFTHDPTSPDPTGPSPALLRRQLPLRSNPTGQRQSRTQSLLLAGALARLLRQ